MGEASNQEIPSKTSPGYVGIIGVIIAVIVIAAVVLIFKVQKSANQTVPNSYQTPSKNAQVPTDQQVTASNAPQVLDETGAAIEADINQLNSDMKTLDQNNTAADNPNSL